MAIYIDRSTQSGGRFNSDREPEVEFAPEKIVHCRYSFRAAAGVGGTLDLVFDKEIKTYALRGEVTFPTFLENLHYGRPNGTTIPNAKPVQTNQPTPFDFGVDRPCYVVIELEKRNNWMFSQKGIAVDRKPANTHDVEDRDLMHVDPDTGLGRIDYHDQKECRIAYFSVLQRTDFLPRLFSFNVRFIDRALLAATETIIDPDIPNTGASPFPP